MLNRIYIIDFVIVLVFIPAIFGAVPSNSRDTTVKFISSVPTATVLEVLPTTEDPIESKTGYASGHNLTINGNENIESSTEVDDPIKDEKDYDDEYEKIETTESREEEANKEISSRITNILLKKVVNNLKTPQEVDENDRNIEDEDGREDGIDEDGDEGYEYEADELISPYVLHVNDSINILKKWSFQISSLLEDLFKEIFPTFVKLSSEIEVTPECTSSLLKLVNALRNQETWAFRSILI